MLTAFWNKVGGFMDEDIFRNLVSFKFPSTGPVVNISGVAGLSIEEARVYLTAIENALNEVENRD